MGLKYMNNKRIQRWFKSNWLTILLLSVAVAIFIGNICVLVYVDGNEQSAWLTLYSGWVSGIATVILGVIAVIQNKNYKNENDSFLQRQKEEYATLITQQTNCTIFNNIMNQRCNYIERIKERLQNFITNFNFRKITLWLGELQVEATSNRPCDDSSQGALIGHFIDNMVVEYFDLLQLIKNDWLKSDYNTKAQEAISEYVEKILDIKSKLNYFEIPKYIKQFNEECMPLLLNLLKAKNEYIQWLDVDFNMVLTTKSGDIDFVKKYYSYGTK